jgi:hypothetical protein
MPADTETHQRPSARHRLRPAIALLAIPIAAVTLAACGGSSSSGSTTTNSASTTKSANATKSASTGSSRFASLRSCLQKEGISLPSRPSGGAGAGQPGSGGPPSGGQSGGFNGGHGGGFKLPEGVSRSKFQEAIKKCGGGFPRGAHPGFDSPTAQAALTKYAACMRENGVNLPTPNTSGKGPVFNTKGIDTASETFKNAQKKCQSDLKGAFGAGRPPGGGQPPAGAEGGPPAGAGGPPPGSEAEGG